MNKNIIYEKIHDIVKKLSKNKIVADVACGDGKNSMSFFHDPKLLKLCDAREYLKENYSKKIENKIFKKIDISDQNDLFNFIKDADIIIYCGHLYHTNDHKEIIETFTKSNATDLIIESKNTSIEVGKDSTPSIETYLESTNEIFNAFHASKEKIKIGRPNFSWTKQILEDHGWEILDHYSVITDRKTFQYFAHASRKI
jgi:hypothetical protein